MKWHEFVLRKAVSLPFRVVSFFQPRTFTKTIRLRREQAPDRQAAWNALTDMFQRDGRVWLPRYSEVRSYPEDGHVSTGSAFIFETMVYGELDRFTILKWNPPELLAFRIDPTDPADKCWEVYEFQIGSNSGDVFVIIGVETYTGGLAKARGNWIVEHFPIR